MLGLPPPLIRLCSRIFKEFIKILRIHLILILGSLIRTGNKMDPDPGHGHLMFTDLLSEEKFQVYFVFFCSLIFILKLDEPCINIEILNNLSLFQQFRIGFWKQKIFSLSFFDILTLGFGPLDPRSWIRIQEAKMFRIQRIQILSTVIFHKCI